MPFVIGIIAIAHYAESRFSTNQDFRECHIRSVCFLGSQVINLNVASENRLDRDQILDFLWQLRFWVQRQECECQRQQQ